MAEKNGERMNNKWRQLEEALIKIGFKPPAIPNDNKEYAGEDDYDEHVKEESDKSRYV